MYVLHIVPEAQEMIHNVFRTTVDANAWDRRMGHCHPRALNQLAERLTIGVKFNSNIEADECEVCADSKSRKSAHPPSDRPHSSAGLALVHVDLCGKHSVTSYGGCEYHAMPRMTVAYEMGAYH